MYQLNIPIFRKPQIYFGKIFLECEILKLKPKINKIQFLSDKKKKKRNRKLLTKIRRFVDLYTTLCTIITVSARN